jgi:hypothetical protein
MHWDDAWGDDFLGFPWVSVQIMFGWVGLVGDGFLFGHDQPPT